MKREPTARERLIKWLPIDGKDLRTWLLFLGGLSGVAYETLVAQADRPTLLVIFASMMGLPLFLKKDSDGGTEVRPLPKDVTTDEGDSS